MSRKGETCPLSFTRRKTHKEKKNAHNENNKHINFQPSQEEREFVSKGSCVSILKDITHSHFWQRQLCCEPLKLLIIFFMYGACPSPVSIIDTLEVPSERCGTDQSPGPLKGWSDRILLVWWIGRIAYWCVGQAVLSTHRQGVFFRCLRSGNQEYH